VRARGKPVRLTGLPPDYLRIASSLGGAAPSQAEAWPLASRDTLLAVVELASFRARGARERALLEELLPAAALNLRCSSATCARRSCSCRRATRPRSWRRSRRACGGTQEELVLQKAEGRGSDRDEVDVPREHEPRDPHADERDHRACRTSRLKTELTAKQRDYVGKIHNAGTSLLTVINDILDFSKIEAGRLDIESVPFSLDHVMQQVAVVTGQKAHEKGLEFLMDIPQGIPQDLVGDPLRLGQILTNLINNAVKFTAQGGDPRQDGAAGADRGEGEAALLGARHRHRHDAGTGRQALPPVHPGGHVHDPQARGAPASA
jgi:hypothetical protein